MYYVEQIVPLASFVVLGQSYNRPTESAWPTVFFQDRDQTEPNLGNDWKWPKFDFRTEKRPNRNYGGGECKFLKNAEKSAVVA